MSAEEDYGWWEEEYHRPVTMCNFCAMERVHMKAARAGKWVQTMGVNGWLTVHIVAYGENMTPENHVCSFWELPPTCAC